MLLDLKRNLQYPANRELQSLMIKAFLDVLLEEEKALDENRNKLTNKAVYLICLDDALSAGVIQKLAYAADWMLFLYGQDAKIVLKRCF